MQIKRRNTKWDFFPMLTTLAVIGMSLALVAAMATPDLFLAATTVSG